MKRKTGGSLNDTDSWREDLTYLKTTSWTGNRVKFYNTRRGEQWCYRLLLLFHYYLIQVRYTSFDTMENFTFCAFVTKPVGSNAIFFVFNAI